MPHLQIPIAELEDFALELAHTAGGIAKAYFRSPLAVENKADRGFDPVTAADRGIEQVLRRAIQEKYPGHGIVAEEQDDHPAQSAYTWFIDPIDGTRSFMMGSPLWGTLIGLTLDGRPLFGLLCQPVLEEIFFGTPGGSWLIKAERRERLRSRRCERLAEASLACTHPDLFKKEAERRAFERLTGRCLLHRYGGDCYNYAMLAAGFVDLVVESGLKPFDIVPLIPVLEGAGCVVSDWTGRAPLQGGAVIAAATPELHVAALHVLAPASNEKP
jgi:myo-inositol-1(or 4)-monophosphatase